MGAGMERIWYYDVAKQKHPEVKEEWVERVLNNPYHTETQQNGRIRYWGFIAEEGKWLRVVVDEGMLLTRFFDHKKLNQWGRP